jgi:hypothetical protein
MPNRPKLDGIPKHIRSKVFPVKDERRTNPLSLTPGGDEVVILYNNGDALYYNKIKYLENYVKTTISQHPGEINRIFLKTDGAEKFDEIDIRFN